MILFSKLNEIIVQYVDLIMIIVHNKKQENWGDLGDVMADTIVLVIASVLQAPGVACNLTLCNGMFDTVKVFRTVMSSTGEFKKFVLVIAKVCSSEGSPNQTQRHQEYKNR